MRFNTGQTISFTLVAFVLCFVPTTQGQIDITLDIMLEGDDPTESFLFDQVGEPSAPSRLAFVGYVESHRFDIPTRLRTAFITAPDVKSPLVTTLDLHSFTMPPISVDTGLVRVPINFHTTLNHTPSAAGILVEGLGAADRFHFTGSFSASPIPEPSMAIFLTLTAASALLRRPRCAGR